MALKSGPGLANWEIATIKKTVSEQRRRHRPLERWEFEDLQQEMLLHWLSIRDRAHPSPHGAPPSAYLAQVVRNKLTDLLRELLSDKRAGESGALSLEAPIGDGEEGMTLGETLADVGLVGTGASSDQGMALRDARMDMTRSIQRLTPAQQALCRLLGEQGLTVKAAAEHLGIPRGTLYEEIKRIRQQFDRDGLRDYLTG